MTATAGEQSEPVHPSPAAPGGMLRRRTSLHPGPSRPGAFRICVTRLTTRTAAGVVESKSIGEVEFITANPRYIQGDRYAVLAKQVVTVLSKARVGRDWSEAIDEAEGTESVPIMTTHKSKGLEYHKRSTGGAKAKGTRRSPMASSCPFAFFVVAPKHPQRSSSSRKAPCYETVPRAPLHGGAVPVIPGAAQGNLMAVRFARRPACR